MAVRCAALAIVMTCSACSAPADPSLGAPRLIAPLSFQRVTSQRPVFRWSLPAGADGAELQLCGDRACTEVMRTWSAHGERDRPAVPLPAGVSFWRARSLAGDRGGGAWSTTWETVLPNRDADLSTTWGLLTDVDGDGLRDVIRSAVSTTASDPTCAVVYLGSHSGLAEAPEGRYPCDPSTTVTVSGSFQAEGHMIPVGDLNGDGWLDLLFLEGGSSAYSAAEVLLGGGGGRLALNSFLGAGHDFASGYPAGDLDGDGFADLFISTTLSSFYVLHGGPTGIRDATPIAAPFSYFVTNGDLDADGWSDALVASESLWPIADIDSAWLVGDRLGTGRLDIGWLTMEPYPVPSSAHVAEVTSDLTPGAVDSWGVSDGGGGTGCARGAAVGDLDGDGLDDIVIMECQRAMVWLGSGRVVTTPVSGDGVEIYEVAGLGDVNGDGYDDVVLSELAQDLVPGWLRVYGRGVDGLALTSVVRTPTALAPVVW